MENQLKEILDKHNIVYVEDATGIAKYFDVTKTDDEGVPEITCEHNVVLIADNADFNETYLIDFVKNFLDKDDMKNLVKGVEFAYLDKVNIRHGLFNPSQERHEGMSDKDFEKSYLRPSILIVNAVENEIHLFQEDFTPMVESEFEKILIRTKILSEKG